MSAVNKGRLLEDLERKLGRPLACALCGGTSLMVSEEVLELDLHVPQHARRKDIVTEALSVVAISCIGCGHVMVFNTHMVDC